MRTRILEVALGEIRAFALVSTDVGEDSWKRLDGLYQQIEQDLGRPATPLARPDLRTIAAAEAPATTTPDPQPAPAQVQPTQTVTAKAASAPVESKTSPFWMVLGLLSLAAVSAGGMWWNLGRQKSRRRTLPSFAADDDVDLPARPVRAAGTSGAARAVRNTSAGSTAARSPKPATAPAQAAVPRQPRPKPKAE
jgi:hypothetical protein